MIRSDTADAPRRRPPSRSPLCMRRASAAIFYWVPDRALHRSRYRKRGGGHRRPVLLAVRRRLGRSSRRRCSLLPWQVGSVPRRPVPGLASEFVQLCGRTAPMGAVNRPRNRCANPSALGRRRLGPLLRLALVPYTRLLPVMDKRAHGLGSREPVAMESGCPLETQNRTCANVIASSIVASSSSELTNRAVSQFGTRIIAIAVVYAATRSRS